LEASLKFGFFPFFSADASSGWTHHVQKLDSTGITVTRTIPEGCGSSGVMQCEAF
jgi:hypothetical protein